MGSPQQNQAERNLCAAAESVGTLNDRTATQQIAHWARIGREIEASPSTNQRDIQRVLGGHDDYDALNELGQAVVRATWDERIAAVRFRLSLAAEFTTTGRSWTDTDEQGGPVARGTDTAAS